ncbi:hypothetical protein TSOC_003265 [Tetrabaena socialis]|uniref:Uncharacterized protein n=1 Tax=Tetrabaena socialis TaxID=47790 RepID=A0A2J8AC15_9CHLO|nr:hypothetical protein TSOC_003265 [Tetrabaena socialis]|eukprot:PNH10037.1 hypothetical protein TSOC_003265 [Tetrabaena socialis]
MDPGARLLLVAGALLLLLPATTSTAALDAAASLRPNLQAEGEVGTPHAAAVRGRRASGRSLRAAAADGGTSAQGSGTGDSGGTPRAAASSLAGDATGGGTGGGSGFSGSSGGDGGSPVFGNPPSAFTFGGFPFGYGGLGVSTAGQLDDLFVRAFFNRIFNLPFYGYVAQALPNQLARPLDLLPPGLRARFDRTVVTPVGYDLLDRLADVFINAPAAVAGGELVPGGCIGPIYSFGVLGGNCSFGDGGGGGGSGGGGDAGGSITCTQPSVRFTASPITCNLPYRSGCRIRGLQYRLELPLGPRAGGYLGPAPAVYQAGVAVNLTRVWLGFNFNSRRVLNDFGVLRTNAMQGAGEPPRAEDAAASAGPAAPVPGADGGGGGGTPLAEMLAQAAQLASWRSSSTLLQLLAAQVLGPTAAAAAASGEGPYGSRAAPPPPPPPPQQQQYGTDPQQYGAPTVEGPFNVRGDTPEALQGGPEEGADGKRTARGAAAQAAATTDAEAALAAQLAGAAAAAGAPLGAGGLLGAGGGGRLPGLPGLQELLEGGRLGAQEAASGLPVLRSQAVQLLQVVRCGEELVPVAEDDELVLRTAEQAEERWRAGRRRKRAEGCPLAADTEPGGGGGGAVPPLRRSVNGNLVRIRDPSYNNTAATAPHAVHAGASGAPPLPAAAAGTAAAAAAHAAGAVAARAPASAPPHAAGGGAAAAVGGRGGGADGRPPATRAAAAPAAPLQAGPVTAVLHPPLPRPHAYHPAPAAAAAAGTPAAAGAAGPVGAVAAAPPAVAAAGPADVAAFAAWQVAARQAARQRQLALLAAQSGPGQPPPPLRRGLPGAAAAATANVAAPAPASAAAAALPPPRPQQPNQPNRPAAGPGPAGANHLPAQPPVGQPQLTVAVHAEVAQPPHPANPHATAAPPQGFLHLNPHHNLHHNHHNHQRHPDALDGGGGGDDGDGGGGGGNHSRCITGVKQRLLSYLFNMCARMHAANPRRQQREALALFRHIDTYRSLLMRRAQLLDRHHLLLDMRTPQAADLGVQLPGGGGGGGGGAAGGGGPQAPGAGGAGAAPSQFYLLLNLQTTRVVSFSSSGEKVVEAYLREAALVQPWAEPLSLWDSGGSPSSAGSASGRGAVAASGRAAEATAVADGTHAPFRLPPPPPARTMSLVRCACATPLSVSTDRSVLPWMREGAPVPPPTYPPSPDSRGSVSANPQRTRGTGGKRGREKDSGQEAALAG